MARVAKPTDPRKLVELKEKIHDSTYLNSAIERIAIIITNKLLQVKEESKE